MSPARRIVEALKFCELAKRFAARTFVDTPADSNKMPPTDMHA
jgi:hypothetical protein